MSRPEHMPIIIATILACIILLPHTPSCEESDSSSSGVVETIAKIKHILTGGEKTYGIQSDAVITSDYDAGFGTAIQFNQTYIHPYIDRPFLRHTPSLHFWGASNDSTDATVVGIMETVTHQIPMKRGFTGYAGLSVGYFSSYKTIEHTTDTGVTSNDVSSNYLDIFITMGMEYKMAEKSSMFFQVRIGETAMSREIHASLGLNFGYIKLPSKKTGTTSPR